MLWFILYIASLITSLVSAANAEEGVASQYGRDSGTRVACGGELDEAALTARCTAYALALHFAFWENCAFASHSLRPFFRPTGHHARAFLHVATFPDRIFLPPNFHADPH